MRLEKIFLIVLGVFSHSAFAEPFLAANTIDLVERKTLVVASCEGSLDIGVEHSQVLEQALKDYSPQNPAQAKSREDIKILTRYYLTGATKKIELNEMEFRLLKLMNETKAPMMIDQIAKELSLSADRVREAIAHVNAQTETIIGEAALITPGEEVRPFSFISNKPGVIYLGRFVKLSEKQTELVRAIHANQGRLTYDRIQEIMGWTDSSTRRNSSTYRDDINRRAISATGKTLLRTVNGVGLEIGEGDAPPTRSSGGGSYPLRDLR